MITLPNSSPTWRSYCDITANAEADLARSSSGFCLSTLEVVKCPGVTGFALVEKIEPGMWRWATVSLQGPILDEGTKPSKEEAKKFAEEALMREASLI